MRDKATVVLAEDHTILREGLKALLALSADFDIVGEAADGLEAIKLVASCAPDLVLLDLAMPRMSGLEAVKEIRRRSPKTRILVLTVHKSEEYVLSAFQSGADGYCLKDASHTELLTAINSVLTGKHYISPGIADKVLEGYLEGSRSLKRGSSWDSLTQREREVLKMIGEGYKNKDIAEYLSISLKTVEKHRSNLMAKLDLHSASALTKYAIEKGLVAE